jgi:hypothetical protein
MQPNFSVDVLRRRNLFRGMFERAIMPFQTKGGRFVLRSVIILLALAPVFFAQTNNLLERSQLWNLSHEWNRFYYHWVDPGFSIPLHEWQTPSEYLWPSLTLDEASAWTGQHVRCAYRSNTVTGGCKVGDRGEVNGIEKVPDGGYFVIVSRDTPSKDEPSYYGRYSSRLFLTRE